MSRKSTLALLTFCILIAMAAASLQTAPVSAEGGISATLSAGGDDLDAQITLTGTIQSITVQNSQVAVLVVDGTPILTNPASVGAAGLQVGQTITVLASIDTDNLVAKVITIAQATEQPTGEVTTEPTAEATAEPTAAATEVATVAPTAAATGVATQAACGSGNTQPVAARLAKSFGVSYDEIMNWHCQGFGFGEIAKAYLLAGKTGKTAKDYFDLRKGGEGWGQIVKDAGVKPSDLAPGQAMKGTADGSGKGNNGNGNGNDKGNNGKGNNGKGNGNDKGNNGNGHK